ncbi:hypothetical protein DKB58_03185 [Capnocytophaga canimorsus]|uniref:hypothetical protein n=1 Tax=Capnocytophaga canimorsus TaxID=28188 RepID=UPI000D6DF414|nr:hypothetical protein [Capnocytophaga canimorsus]AWL78024.1 hypothetical protein DKB58_03185 [Capnocytophaga canimorsus]
MSNPIQQQIEQLTDRWTNFYSIKEGKIYILRDRENNRELVDTFFDYMLSTDSQIDDIVIQFNTPFFDVESFSKDLIEELQQTINIWNRAKKEGDIDDFYIDWKFTDISNKNRGCKTAFFIENINSFCEYLNLDKGQRLVCVIYFNSNQYSNIQHWLNEVLIQKFHIKLSLLLFDTYENNYLELVRKGNTSDVILIETKFNLSKAIEQIASMSNTPLSAETAYRSYFVKLMNAISEYKEDLILQNANKCIEIASKELLKDSNWYSQITIIYITLSNNEIRKKAYKKAISYIDEALLNSQKSLDKVADDVSYRLLGQCFLLRGGLFHLLKKNNEAITDFLQADASYEKCFDYIMQIEALRMVAYCAKKEGKLQERKNALIKGVSLGQKINVAMAQASSFALLMKDFLTIEQKQFSWQEIDHMMSSFFGHQWNDYINKVGTTQVVKFYTNDEAY